MGAKSCRVSSDKLEINSPIFGCLIRHCACDSTCIETVEEIAKVEGILVQVEVIPEHTPKDLPDLGAVKGASTLTPEPDLNSTTSTVDKIGS